ncbi:hypothetical protein MA16_Dca018366 [Dendrobium catenatum]|uniref:Uncharacterized protein n=1 Tax=Dendrobium catenatum TaxID=906689 RepID=A0A2I0XAT3_9ASPA|nr:hypothetical protein MA16_Dca018366 [Dendrobium catenatum]
MVTFTASVRAPNETSVPMSLEEEAKKLLYRLFQHIASREACKVETAMKKKVHGSADLTLTSKSFTVSPPHVANKDADESSKLILSIQTSLSSTTYSRIQPPTASTGLAASPL